MFTTTLALVAQSGRATLITIAKNILAESRIAFKYLIERAEDGQQKLKRKDARGRRKAFPSGNLRYFSSFKVREEKIPSDYQTASRTLLSRNFRLVIYKVSRETLLYL